MPENRKLATIRRVVNVEPIDGADRIEKVTIDGWQCVCKKGDVKPNDLCCYIEIDSQLPPTPYFEFMKDRKYRVKTIKLRKQISQGLIVPLKKDEAREYIPDEIRQDNPKGSRIYVEEGSDVTDILNITKYQSPSDQESDYVGLSKKKHGWFIKFMTRFEWYRKLTKTKSKSFPEWISKTDEERLQNMPWVLTKEADKQFYVTEKLDGQSATYWYKHRWLKPEFGICSRAIRKFEFDNINWSRVAKQLDIKNKLKVDGRNIAIQGEIIGPTIQGNKYKLTEFDFYVFNVFDIDNKKYFNWNDLKLFCDLHGFRFVPELEYNFKLLPTVNEMIDYAKGTSTLLDTEREGVVIRTYDQKISFKCINPIFLLKHEE